MVAPISTNISAMNTAGGQSSIFDGLGDYLGGLFGGQAGQNVIGGLASYFGSEQIKDEIDKGIAAQAAARSGLLEDIASRGQFQPFTVTSSLATVPADAQGGFNINLATPQQTLQDSLMTQASGVFNEIGADRATREQEVFDRLQALRQPQQERDRLELQNQLFQQGRQGLQTSAYGGTPEQLTFEKAIQEQQAADALAAMTQAGKERQEALALGSGLLGAGFVPQREALNLLTTGGNLARLPLALQRDVLGGAVNTGREQLTSQAQMQRDKTQVDLDLLDALVQVIAGQQNKEGMFTGGLLSSVGQAGGEFLEGVIDKYLPF